MFEIDKIKEVTQNGQNDWRSRTGGEIHLVSPDGNEFYAKYSGDDVSKGNNVQITAYPDTIGNYTKHISINSDYYSINLEFDGPDNDKESKRFWNSTNEIGQWGVNHPVDGYKSLQLLYARKYNRPVSGGGLTIVETSWISPVNEEKRDNGKKLRTMADYSATNIYKNSSLSFLEKAITNTRAAKQSIKNNTDKILKNINNILGPISSLNTEIFGLEMQLQNTLNDLYNAALFEPIKILSNLHAIITFPCLATTDMKTKITSYDNMILETMSQIIDTGGGNTRINVNNDKYARNDILMSELTTISSFVTFCNIATTSEIKSKVNGINLIEKMYNTFIDIKEKAYKIQESYETSGLVDRYIFCEEIETLLLEHINIVTRYILSEITNIKTDRIIITESVTTPYKIAYSEYENPTDEDALNLIEKNNLSCEDILLLMPGKEILL